MDSNSIKNNIRAIRERLGFTQQEMADRMGLSRTAYRQLETGKTRLFSKQLENFADTCGISLEECFLGFIPISEEAMIAREQNPDNEYFKARYSELENKISALQEELSIKNESIKTLTDINTRLTNQLGTIH